MSVSNANVNRFHHSLLRWLQSRLPGIITLISQQKLQGPIVSDLNKLGSKFMRTFTTKYFTLFPLSDEMLTLTFYLFSTQVHLRVCTD